MPTPCRECFTDLFAPVHQFKQVEYRHCATFSFTHQRNAGGLAAGVNLDAQGLKLAGFSKTVKHANGERQQLVYSGTATFQ